MDTLLGIGIALQYVYYGVVIVCLPMIVIEQRRRGGQQ